MRSSYVMIMMLLLCSVYAYAWSDGDKMGSDILEKATNPFMDTANDRMQWIIPSLFLLITLIAAFVDFGAIGITIASMLGMIALTSIGILAISTSSVIAFIILGGILIFKLYQ